MTLPRWALALVACAGLAFAACGGTPATTSKGTAPPSSPSSSSTSPSTLPASTSSSSTSTVVSTTSCAQVAGASGSSEGAAGTITGFITVTNSGSRSCALDGYPTMALFSGSGAPLTVTVVDGLTVSLTPPANAPPASVTLAPSAAARFAYQLSDVPSGSATSCPASEVATVTMPGASASSPTFRLAIAPCDNGTIRVSPVFAD